MERSTMLNKNLKSLSCKPLKEWVGRSKALNSYFFFFFLLLIAGCGGLPATRVHWEADRPAECRTLYEKVNAAVISAGVSDAAEAPVAGFPYLRANRFTVSLAGTLPDAAAENAWVQWMREIDLSARRKEIFALPDDAVKPMAASREDLFSRTVACSKALHDFDRARPEFFEEVKPRVAVPGEYSDLLRIIGLYPLVTIPEYKITAGVRERIRSWYQIPYEELRPEGVLRAYRPPSGQARDAREIIAASRHTPLDIPRPSVGEARELALRYAPVIIQDEAAPYDRVGRIVRNGERLTVDGQKPTVYYYLTHARVKGEAVLQVNYAFWYPARSGGQAPAIEHGHLDGLTLRFSFDAAGRLFMLDLMNNCGCYHLFIPARDRVERMIQRYYPNDPFAPQWLPDIAPGKSPAARIMSGWHQVQRILAVSPPEGGTPYELLPYELLESLPGEGGHSRSMFDAQGIAWGSERVERFIYFPTGIPSIGSMRQRGHHAITLSEQTCFDEPGLFEYYFEFR
jgi:hypothetical protein